MSELTGKVVIVTGASRGIGRASCLAAAERRPCLALGARDAAGLEEVAAACRARGAEALPVATDVTRPEECARLVERTRQRFGRVDALVNNAGIEMIARFDEVRDLACFERLMRVNYLGYVYPTYFALPELKRTRGRILAVSSLAGLTGVPTRTAYAATKHAVFGFFESLRIELRGSGVSVTLVAPDYVATEIHRRAAGPDGAPLGESPLQEGRIMSAEACGEQIVRALERRRRLAVLSLRGRAGRWVRLLAPGLIDVIAVRAVRRGK